MTWAFHISALEDVCLSWLSVVLLGCGYQSTGLGFIASPVVDDFSLGL